MKKCFVKPIAAAVCAVVLAGGAGSAVYARSSVKNETEVRGAGYSAPAAGTEKNELTKDETVYVLAQADGSVRKIIVSDWIKNTLGSDSIRDDSSLTGVENVKGDETYTVIALYKAAGVSGTLQINDGESLRLQYFALDALPPLESRAAFVMQRFLRKL